ncbi:perforin-1-like [Tiliqua scincoides]|uniref:perforin-1-like n=1 Tax=Tiliqua scincoides TaxID=71010 RepID=UPI0034618349
MHKGNPNSAACMFLLFLLLTPVSPQCRSGTADECKKAGFVPGHNLAGQGFDITTMERRKGKIVDMEQWEKTDGTCTLCRNTWLEGKPFQRLPLAAIEWKASIACKREVIDSVEHSVSSVAEMAEKDVHNAWKRGLDLPAVPQSPINAQWVWAGSHSDILKFSRRLSLEDKYIFIRHETLCKYYRFRIKANPPINEYFKVDVNSLPDKYDSTSKSAYHRLIGTYGTHVLASVDLGGRQRSLTAIPQCEMMLTGLTATEVLSCLSVLVGLTIGAGNVNGSTDFQTCQKVKNEKQFMEKFSKMKKVRHTEAVGGNKSVALFAGKEHTKEYIQWMGTVKSVPGLIAYQLDPIHSLVAEQDPRREGLQRAVSDYIKARPLVIRCTNTCPSGHKPTADEDCACKCSSFDTINDLCCPKDKGLGKLTVWIDRAYNLHGDLFSKTDAFVQVAFEGMSSKTPIVWNNNNPEFHAEFHFGSIDLLRKKSKLKIVIKEWDPWGVQLLDHLQGQPHVECFTEFQS